MSFVTSSLSPVQGRANPASHHSYRLYLAVLVLFLCARQEKSAARHQPCTHFGTASSRHSQHPPNTHKGAPNNSRSSSLQCPSATPLSTQAYTRSNTPPTSFIMSAGAKFSTRYLLAKFSQALEAMRRDLPAAAASTEPQSLFQRFQEAYKQQMTSVMAITGAAMAPALNPGWLLLICCC